MYSQERALAYAEKLISLVSQIFDDESEIGIKIDIDDFEDDDNTTAFIYALAVIMPCHFYQAISDIDHCTYIDFNHLTTKLSFQFSTTYLKAEKWDALKKKIGKAYGDVDDEGNEIPPEDPGMDLPAIGEIAARDLGFM